MYIYSQNKNSYLPIIFHNISLFLFTWFSFSRGHLDIISNPMSRVRPESYQTNCGHRIEQSEILSGRWSYKVETLEGGIALYRCNLDIILRAQSPLPYEFTSNTISKTIGSVSVNLNLIIMNRPRVVCVEKSNEGKGRRTHVPTLNSYEGRYN